MANDISGMLMMEYDGILRNILYLDLRYFEQEHFRPIYFTFILLSLYKQSVGPFIRMNAVSFKQRKLILYGIQKKHNLLSVKYYSVKNSNYLRPSCMNITKCKRYNTTLP